MKFRDKISISLILFTVGIFVAQLFIEQTTVFSKLNADIEEFSDFANDIDDGNEDSSEEGSEENSNENDDQVPIELYYVLNFCKTGSENNKDKGRTKKVRAVALIIYDTPPELKV